MQSEKKREMLRRIPAVGRILSSPKLSEISAVYPRNLVLNAVHQVLEGLRILVETGHPDVDGDLFSLDRILGEVEKNARRLSAPSLRPLINATGVVVHTNLGRSLLAEPVLGKLGPVAGGYSNLEYDLGLGKRGSRYSHVEGILKELTSAEAAMVVNNNAAAVLVALDTLARDREVVVSRGQLVEIGGSFRIPDVMRRSGARMIEVGTTNKTHMRDYEGVIGPETGLLLKVHQSNFQVVGFTQQVNTVDLVNLGRRYSIPVMEDLGSGCLVDFSKYGWTLKEPTVSEVLAQGVDLVTFSGDKMLGGPQAGIILGRKNLVEAIRRNQLSRALRIDKLTLVALEQTLRLYRDERTAVREIPTLRMILQPYPELRAKARRLLRMIGRPDHGKFTLELVDGNSKVGGGALPMAAMPSRLLSLIPGELSVQAIGERLRAYDPPIIVRLEKDRVLLDLRTIQDGELKTVAQAIRSLAVT
ncbi:MAG: L-seryl-tRNA(Sec) selenium transferase [Deltaproteobacteria bacterium]|nr:L-seryl-tRNA(Sec) selenium transferase [Deltaproteobacteria bacterium]